ncbi:MAG: hypothetical protein Q9227_006228 [Pyrenula ochraceoflavens]
MSAAVASAPASLDHLAHNALPKHLQAFTGRVEQPQLGWLRETSTDTPVEEMRRRLEEDGYVFVKGAIPRQDVLKMRADYFSQYADNGMLKPGTDFVDGIYNDIDNPEEHSGIGGSEPEGGKDLQTLIEAHSKEDYRTFVAHPSLRKIVRDLRGWDSEILLDRTLLRHNVPHGRSTGVHYDKLFLRGGDAYFLTAWVPIGDIKFNGGGLIYLENSAGFGEAIENDFTRRAAEMTPEERVSAFNANMNSNGILSENPNIFERDHDHIAKASAKMGNGYKWLIANYKAGDVVFHHPCTIHTSCSNEDTEGRIRLSTDLRFYDKKDFDDGKADNRWMKIWTPGDGL